MPLPQNTDLLPLFCKSLRDYRRDICQSFYSPADRSAGNREKEPDSLRFAWNIRQPSFILRPHTGISYDSIISPPKKKINFKEMNHCSGILNAAKEKMPASAEIFPSVAGIEIYSSYSTIYLEIPASFAVPSRHMRS